jgi:hypothetical protein
MFESKTPPAARIAFAILVILVVIAYTIYRATARPEQVNYPKSEIPVEAQN